MQAAPPPIPHLLPALSSVPPPHTALLELTGSWDPWLVLKGRQGGLGVGVRDVQSDALGHELPAGHAEDAAGSLGTRRRKVLSLGNGVPRRSPGEPPPHMRAHGEPPGFSEGHICISAKQAEAAGAHSPWLTAVPAWTTLLGDPAAFGSDFTA